MYFNKINDELIILRRIFVTHPSGKVIIELRVRLKLLNLNIFFDKIQFYVSSLLNKTKKFQKHKNIDNIESS